MKKTSLVVCLLLSTGCATVRSGGDTNVGSMDRAERARCSTVGVRAPFTAEDAVGLEGAYDLYLFADSTGAEATGTLELESRSASTQPGGDPIAGPPPDLLGSTDVDATAVGAVVPGPATSREEGAPGVGVYRSAEGAIFVRLGSESNRRDRTRYDGAHTTLVVSSIGPDRFGGAWSSADGADSMSGEFCAARQVE